MTYCRSCADNGSTNFLQCWRHAWDEHCFWRNRQSLFDSYLHHPPTTTVVEQWIPKFGIIKDLVCFRSLFTGAFIQITMVFLEIIGRLEPRQSLDLFTFDGWCHVVYSPKRKMMLHQWYISCTTGAPWQPSHSARQGHERYDLGDPRLLRQQHNSNIFSDTLDRGWTTPYTPENAQLCRHSDDPEVRGVNRRKQWRSGPGESRLGPTSL